MKSSRICMVEEWAVQEDQRRRLITPSIMTFSESTKKLKNQKYEKRIGRRLSKNILIREVIQINLRRSLQRTRSFVTKRNVTSTTNMAKKESNKAVEECTAQISSLRCSEAVWEEKEDHRRASQSNTPSR